MGVRSTHIALTCWPPLHMHIFQTWHVPPGLTSTKHQCSFIFCNYDMFSWNLLLIDIWKLQMREYISSEKGLQFCIKSLPHGQPKVTLQPVLACTVCGFALKTSLSWTVWKDECITKISQIYTQESQLWHSEFGGILSNIQHLIKYLICSTQRKLSLQLKTLSHLKCTFAHSKSIFFLVQ